ncbi:uncharacterized protein LOC135147958 [Daucus carota subsp. sativus]|uniref:uncharacterized protein LOC135147958 n=1 Tax=Daucus carota subsp. sativus TaxID=79200 RepID=UPI003083C760
MTFIVCHDTNDEPEQMGRRDDREAEVLLLSNEMQNPNVRDAAAAISTLSNEMQNPNVRDAAAAISTRIPPVPDLNIHPLDLNRLPPTEEEFEEEEDRNHMTTHESEIQNPRPHVGEPDICVICQDEYAAEELVGGLRCGHEYHMKCIKKWLRRITKCPICRDTAIFVEPVTNDEPEQMGRSGDREA